jgi:hypothetical protein
MAHAHAHLQARTAVSTCVDYTRYRPVLIIRADGDAQAWAHMHARAQTCSRVNQPHSGQRTHARTAAAVTAGSHTHPKNAQLLSFDTQTRAHRTTPASTHKHMHVFTRAPSPADTHACTRPHAPACGAMVAREHVLPQEGAAPLCRSGRQVRRRAAARRQPRGRHREKQRRVRRVLTPPVYRWLRTPFTARPVALALGLVYN